MKKKLIWILKFLECTYMYKKGHIIRISRYILGIQITNKDFPTFLSNLIQSKQLSESYSNIWTNLEMIMKAKFK